MVKRASFSASLRALVVLLVGVVVLALSSCKRDGGEEVDYPPVTIEIPGALNVFIYHNIVTPTLPPLAAEDYLELIPREIRLLAIDGNNLDFILGARVYLQSDNLPDLEAFYYDNLPNGTGVELRLIPGVANMKNYLQSDFRIRLRLELRDSYIFPIPVRVSMGFLGYR